MYETPANLYVNARGIREKGRCKMSREVPEQFLLKDTQKWIVTSAVDPGPSAPRTTVNYNGCVRGN
jgi:hypothetical protein